MTAPYDSAGDDGNFVFRDAELPSPGQSVELGEPAGTSAPMQQRNELPPPVLEVSEEKMEQLKIWTRQWIEDLENAQQDKQKQWDEIETAYRARQPEALEFEPFKGSCRDVIPAVRMACDPVHARLDTGIFRQDSIISLKALRKDVKEVVPGLSKFIDFYLKRYINFRQIAAPRLMEFAKLGTMVFKTIYDREEHSVLKYSEDKTKTEKSVEVRFAGPKILGISRGDCLFPASYQHLQDCPVFFERQRTTYEKLLVAQKEGKLANVEKIRSQQTTGNRTTLEESREKAAQYSLRTTFVNEVTVYEGWCDYDIDGDGVPEHLILTFEKDTQTFLQLRLNWYFHQRKAYSLAPYTVANDSLDGIGVGERALPFQKAITNWQREATNNAMLANIRMFIARKGSGIEEVPRLYTGRTFFVDEPTKDFIPFAVADIYPSTLVERQNLFGMLEKDTGVTDYLQGRESPIIGTRATATSTLALIQEGTRRVEAVLDNARQCFAEVIQNCLSIWIQFGTNGLEDIVFEDDAAAAQIKQFFATATQENVNGMFAIGLSVTEASSNKQAQQQMQLALIQVMMQYLEKLLAAGQGALQAISMGIPQYAEMVKDVMAAARVMFRDLAIKYEVPDPDEYLPSLEKYLNAPVSPAAGAASGASPEGQPSGAGGESSLPVPNGPYRGPTPGRPATPGSGVGASVIAALAGAGKR